MLQLTEEMKSLLRHVHVNMPWHYLPKYLEMVLALGMNIEIGFDATCFDTTGRKDLQRIAGRLQQAGCGITLHGPFWDLGPGSVDPLVRQVSQLRLQQFLDLLPVFDPIQVVCHTGYDPSHHRGQRQFWLEKSLAFWEPLVARAEASKTVLLLENVWESGPGFHQQLLEQIDSPHLGFCLDVGHQNSFSRTPLHIWLETLGGFIKEIHLHDNDGSEDAHLPVGQGNIDFLLLFGFLRNQGKSPLLTLEPHEEEHLAQSLQGLESILAQLPNSIAPARDSVSTTEYASWPL